VLIHKAGCPAGLTPRQSFLGLARPSPYPDNPWNIDRRKQDMTVTNTTSGSPRKTLATQLDRLDSILDGLSDGLSEAVATAVEGAVERAVGHAVSEAVKETLQAVVAELLSNADLLTALRGVLPTAPPQTSTDPREPPKGLFRRACDGVKAGLGAASTACGCVVGQAARVKPVARAGWQLARKFKGRVLAACGAGITAGVVTLGAGPWLGVAAASVGGFCATLVAQARNALRSLFCPSPAPA
jgi:hypothetical protein